jgi:vacuolar-type H+-ATPase subunit I/STV1
MEACEAMDDVTQRWVMNGVTDAGTGPRGEDHHVPGPQRPVTPEAVDAASNEVGAALGQLLSEAGEIADRLAVRPPEIESQARDLDELEDLRLALVARTEAANERYGTAERLIEQSRARLVEIAEAQRQASETLEAADAKATSIVAEAESRAANLQAQAERKAVARIRRSERQAADLLSQAEEEAKRILAEAQATVREADIRAAQTIASAQARVDLAVEEATRARHAEVDRLRAREHEVDDRIRDLLANPGSLSSLPRAEPRRVPAQSAGSAEPVAADPMSDLFDPVEANADGTIDLTDVSGAISEAIDDWVERREPR